MALSHPLRTNVATAGCIIALAAAMALAVASRAAGVHFFGNHPAVVVTTGVAVLAMLVIAHRLGGAWPAWRRALVTLAWLHAVYIAAWGGAALLLAETGPSAATNAVFVVAAAGHVPIIARLTLLPLLSARYLTTAPPAWPARTVVALGLGTALLGALLAPGFGPFDGIEAPLGGAFLELPAVTAALEVINLAFLATTLLPTAIAARAARRESGERRRRLSVVATAGLVPVALVQFCLLTGLAADMGGASDDATTVLLFVGLALACPLAAAGNTLALRTPLGLDGAALARATAILLGAIAALTAVPVGIIFSHSGGPAAGLWAALAAVVVMVLLQPVQARLARALAADTGGEPASVVAGRRLEGLTKREQEVLELLAAGLSNAGIAQRLVLSGRTVDAHIRSIFAKLDLPAAGAVNRRVHAVLAWQERRGPSGSQSGDGLGENTDASSGTVS